MLQRGIWINWVAVALAAASCGAPPSPSGAPDAPDEEVAEIGRRLNLVVVMADDLDLASYRTALRLGLMPNLVTHLIDRGTTFEEAFVTNSLCCPSRATFLTGQYSHNHGVRSNLPPTGGVGHLDEARTLATWLKSNGHRTGHIGKYLNGYGMLPAFPDTYVPAGWDDWQGLVDPSTYRMYDYVLNDNGALRRYGDAPGDYQTDVLAARSVDFILESERQDDVPFFLVVAPVAPHVEVGDVSDGEEDPPGATLRPAPRHVGTVTAALPRGGAFNEADVSDKPRFIQDKPTLTSADVAHLELLYRNRLEAMRAVDDLIGQVVEALRSAGELARTVLVFTSDNGYLLGQHRLYGKTWAYEESIRVPLVIALPGQRIPRTSTALVVNNDLAPTLTALARAPGLPDVDGRSLKPLLGETAPAIWRKRFLVEHWPNASTIAQPYYAAVRTGPSSTGAADQLYVEYRRAGRLMAREQYALASDAHQLTSVHASSSTTHVQQRQQLRQGLEALRTCAGATCREAENR